MEESRLKKVLIVTHGFPPSELGGTELYSYNLAKSLSDKGMEISIFTRLTRPLSGRDISDAGYVLEKFEGLKVFRAIDSTNNLREFLNPYISKTFKKVILNEKPDLIHFQHLVFLSADFPEIAASYNIPSIMTFHDYWFLCPRVQLLNKENKICEGPVDGTNCAFCFDTPLVNEYRFLNRLKKLVPSRFKTLVKRIKQDVDNKRTTYTSKVVEFHFRLDFLKRQLGLLKYKISPSYYLIKRYEKEGFSGLNYFPHGFPPVPKVDLKLSKMLRIGYMGNINYPKGLAVVVDRLYSLLMERSITLVIHGQPYDLQYFNDIRKRIKQLPTGSVEFYGGYKNTFENLWKIFSSFDVLVFPSVWEENSPIVVRESLLSGRPIIASHLGGIPEIVKDGINGLLFDPFKESDLADKVKKLLDDNELRERLVKGAQETKVDTIEEHTDKIFHLYEDVFIETKALNLK